MRVETRRGGCGFRGFVKVARRVEFGVSAWDFIYPVYSSSGVPS